MLLSLTGPHFAFAARVFFLIVVLCGNVIASELTVTRKPAPDRGGAYGMLCPPNFHRASGEKQDFNTDSKGNPQKYGDDEKRMLYYEGETKLVLTADDGSKTDLKVVEWCKAQEPFDKGEGLADRFIPKDYFAYEIFTSNGDIEVSQVPPDQHL